MSWNELKIKNQVLVFVGAAEKYYEKDLASKIPEIKINGRLKKVLGRFSYYDLKNEIKPISLDFAKFMLHKYSDDVIKSVIGHETAHLITSLIYGGNHGHDKIFKKVCKILSDNTGIEISSGTVEENITFRKEYIEERQDKEKFLADRKKELGRYMLKCRDCDKAKFYKKAKKGSIENWVLNYRCTDNNHKTGLVCYDLKEKVKYENNMSEIVKSKMSVAELAECDKIILKKY